MLAGDATASQPPWTTEQGMTASDLCVGAGGKGGISFGEGPVWASVMHHVLSSTLAITAQVTRKVIYPESNLLFLR